MSENVKRGDLWTCIYETLRLREDSDYKSPLPQAEVEKILNSGYVVYVDEDLPPVLLEVISQYGGHGLKLKCDFKPYQREYPWLRGDSRNPEMGENCVTVAKIDELRVATLVEIKNKCRSKRSQP